jgi:NCS1 family nucleobase:cation symporter-1
VPSPTALVSYPTAPDAHRAVEAPRTLAEPPAKVHGFLDQFGLWANFGISLLVPVVVVFFAPTSFIAAVAAVVLGTVLGCTLVGAVAAIGSQLSSPTMVLFRGLFGRTGSYLPTALNVVQCLGWATFEIWIISVAARAVWPDVPRWIFVIAAGCIATAMALRPLGSTKILKRVAVVAVVLCSAYFLIQAGSKPLGSLTSGGWHGFWTNFDLVIAMSVSWIPLVADYSRHGRDSRTSGIAVGLGYGVASAAFFMVGILGVRAYSPADGDLIGAMLAVPAGALALAILAIDELDEAFANIYSTAISAQNVLPRADRRLLALGVGLVATLLGLIVADGYSYEGFLLLIGAVFTPLGAVLVIDYFLLRKGKYDVSDNPPARWAMIVPWVSGFVAYQLIAPTYVSNWTAWQTFWFKAQGWVDISPTNGFSAAITAFLVAGVLTFAFGRIPLRTAVRPSQ